MNSRGIVAHFPGPQWFLMMVVALALVVFIFRPPAQAATGGEAARIDSIKPLCAGVGDQVTITGIGFGARNVQIAVGGVLAQVASATGHNASFVVPYVSPGSTTVTATNPGGHTGSISFHINKPEATACVNIGSTGGTITDPNGLSVTIPPGALTQEVTVEIQPLSETQIPVAIPGGSSFLGGIALDLGGTTLSAPAVISIPAPASLSPETRLLVAQVVQVGPFERFTMVDTASEVAGVLRTNSPPFPGVLSGGAYAFMGMSQGTWILGSKVLDAGGTPVKGAFIDLLTQSIGEATPIGSIQNALQTYASFVGRSIC